MKNMFFGKKNIWHILILCQIRVLLMAFFMRTNPGCFPTMFAFLKLWDTLVVVFLSLLWIDSYFHEMFSIPRDHIVVGLFYCDILCVIVDFKSANIP